MALSVDFNKVEFGYNAAEAPLFSALTLHIATGWTGVVGANGAGKTTFLKLATGVLAPGAGRILLPPRSLYCPQRTDVPPEDFRAFLECTDKSASVVKGQLEIGPDWALRWETLSHGERKRAQIGTAIWWAPDLLAVDEPTNHVDAEARELLVAALRSFPGVGLLVSHDRDLLDGVCRRTLFIDPPEVRLRKGGYTSGRQVAEEEQSAVRKKREAAKRKYNRLRREAGRRRDSANRGDRRCSKGRIARKDHDAKQKVDAARLTGKDAVGGKLLRQLEGRLDRTRGELEQTRSKKENRLGIRFPGERSLRDLLLDMPAREIPLGGGKYLSCPALAIRPTDRIGIAGRNGAGKSTLVRKILAELNVPESRITYVPQEVTVSHAREILGQVRELTPVRKGMLMTIVSRLGSRPERLLESTTPSPGEIRKLLLALGMSREPNIVLMDEPTNHMDLPSVECLEQALSESPGALVLVSHDRRFLGALTEIRWHITSTGAGRFVLA
jgi:ATPase subunit of ABC transporter with duplicated ATPase domains